MPHYVGIDLGTTNSAICSFDGENLTVHKSPTDQNSVTPSVIFVDRRGRYYGTRAYNSAAHEPGRAAAGFKRFMGTSTPVELSAAQLTMTPEECSAELLGVLYGYLPEEVRDARDVGTVITVPAAFDLMQKDATLSAAQAAGIGRVALMQEPVAAIMAAMRARATDGMFIVYDLGGGTFDLALAESTSGRVTLVEHGGIAVCGGRDIDRLIVESMVKPWLKDQFRCSESDLGDASKLSRLATFAAERAKIELSARDSATILLNESDSRIQDQGGRDIYIDVQVSRADLDRLIAPLIDKTIEHAHRVIKDAGLTPDHVTRVVFVGGPTQYKPLRDRVCRALGIAQDTQVDPMTAVAEGAALFAETYDWTQAKPQKKANRGTTTDIASGLRLDYPARLTDKVARIKCVIATQSANLEIQIDNLDTGWSSGRRSAKTASEVEVDLPKRGPNRFKVFLFADGRPVILDGDLVTIERMTASIDAIPASHSIAVEVRDPASPRRSAMKFLVRKGDALPKKGRQSFRALESLRAGSDGALIFRLWEGEIADQPSDNRPVGCLKITGRDFDTGIIKPNDELVCDYEMSDSGRLSISVSVDSVGAVIKPGGEFYSRQEGEIDFRNAGDLVKAQAATLLNKLEGLEERVEDDRIDATRATLVQAFTQADIASPDAVKQAADSILHARQTLADLRRTHRKDMRLLELAAVVEWFEEQNRLAARPSEVTAFQQMTTHAERALERPGGEFENIIDEMKGMNWSIQFRQPAWIVRWFQNISAKSYLFDDKEWFEEKVAEGRAAHAAGDIDRLKEILGHLYQRQVVFENDADSAPVNIG